MTKQKGDIKIFGYVLRFLIFFFWAYYLSVQIVLVQTASAQTVSAIYGSGLHPLVEISDQGQAQPQIQRLNIFGPGGQILAQVVNGETHYLLADHGRSTRVVCKEDNSPLGNFDYTPYGETSFTGDVDSVTYRYTGQPVNSGLNSYHFHHREYDPGILRFTSIDPARYNESPYIYSNSSPTSFMDLTGGQPQYLTLWLSQRMNPLSRRGDGVDDHLYFHDMRFAGNYSSSVEGYPKGIVFGDLALAGTNPGTRGAVFSDEVRLGSIVVSAHGNSREIIIDSQKGLGPKEFFDHLLHRVEEIDPLGVEQVNSITLFSCHSGCLRRGQPSFADRFLSEIPRRVSAGEPGEPYFPKLDRVTSSPYGMAFLDDGALSKNRMFMEFSTALKFSRQSGSYFMDVMKTTLDTGKFLSGDGLFATMSVYSVAFRNYFNTRGSRRPVHSKLLFDEPKDDSGELSFPTFFLKESSL